jgi:integrase
LRSTPGACFGILAAPQVNGRLPATCPKRCFSGSIPTAPQNQLAGWLFKIARNVARDYHRQRCRRPETDLGLASEGTKDAQQEMALALKQALAMLPDLDRDVFLLREVGGLSREEINWGRFQDPPYLTTTPFHRFGVNIKVKEETKRDRRIGLQEEQALLAACSEMNGADHRYVGAPMHDRLIGALETCCRQGEMLKIQNRHVDWDKHQIAIPGKHAKDAENRRIPFDPEGRLAPVLKRRISLGPSAFVFGSPAG